MALTGVAAPRPASTNDTATAQVTVVSDAAATTAFIPEASIVARLVDRGLVGFSGKSTTADAWRAYVSAKDVVGFKVTSGPGPLTGTRLAVVDALVKSLLAAGQKPEQIVIWDRQLSDLEAAGYGDLSRRLGVRLAGAVNSGWEKDKVYESSMYGKLMFGDLEFGKTEKDPSAGRRSHVSKLLTQDLTKIVTVAPVLNHNLAGVNGHLVGLALASVDNAWRFQSETNVIAESVPEICALDDIWQKVAFGVSDALVCQFRGEATTLLHYAIALNELRFSTDPVALDVLALADVENARANSKLEGERPYQTDLFRNAALIELGVADRKAIQIKAP
jgi:hypothetical protein